MFRPYTVPADYKDFQVGDQAHITLYTDTNPYTADEDTRDLYPSSYQLNENWGFQVNFMVPLDREGLRQCKRIAKRQEEKMRLDYELVRALKCAELMQRGFTYHPKSEMKVLCQDIVPISALQPPKKKKFWQR